MYQTRDVVIYIANRIDSFPIFSPYIKTSYGGSDVDWNLVSIDSIYIL